MAKCHGCDGVGRERTLPEQVCSFCHGSGTNGVDLLVDKGRELSLRRDLLPERALCLRRVGNGVWCQRASGHDGDCANETAAPLHGPLEARPALWRRHRGQSEPK